MVHPDNLQSPAEPVLLILSTCVNPYVRRLHDLFVSVTLQGLCLRSTNLVVSTPQPAKFKQVWAQRHSAYLSTVSGVE